MDTKLWVLNTTHPNYGTKKSHAAVFSRAVSVVFSDLLAMQHFGANSFAQLEDVVPRAKHCIVLL